MEEVEEEENKKLFKDELRQWQKVDSMVTITRLRMKLEKHS